MRKVTESVHESIKDAHKIWSYMREEGGIGKAQAVEELQLDSKYGGNNSHCPYCVVDKKLSSRLGTCDSCPARGFWGGEDGSNEGIGLRCTDEGTEFTDYIGLRIYITDCEERSIQCEGAAEENMLELIESMVGLTKRVLDGHTPDNV